MGHIRLSRLPRTRAWKQVVALIEGGAGAAQVANATMTAAEAGLARAADDKGLVETIWLLTQIPLAARSDDFGKALRNVGFDVGESCTLMEVVGAFSDAVDRSLAETGGRSDLGEMAQMAAAQTLTRVIGERTGSLFETTPVEVQQAFGQLATNRQFSIFAREFFARLTERYLDSFVSRAVCDHVGEGRRFPTLAQQAEFSKALGLHCHEASKIVEAFAGGWFNKTNWERGGITRTEASGFAYVALKKITDELKEGARPDGK